MTIIDTGSSASFIPQLSTRIEFDRLDLKPANLVARSADNQPIAITQKANMLISVEGITSPVEATFYLLPNRTDILSFDAIIGLDLIRALNIRVEQRQGKMVAIWNDQIIGVETEVSAQPAVALLRHESLPADTVEALVSSYSDIFSEIATTYIDTEPMAIPLIRKSYFKARLRRQSNEDLLEIHNQITRLLQNDIIEPSNSPYSSNVHLVPKKNGQKRLVVNFIPLNEISKKDNYPLPQLEDLFSALRGARYYAALDCTEGFLQIPILESHRERTAFTTPQGLFHFKRCPFGYTNSPAKFQRTMNQVFEQGLYRRCVVYIDDILVYGKTQEELINNLEWVFERCRSKRVQLKASKCKFLATEIDFLGFKVSHNSIAPVPGKGDPLKEGIPVDKLGVLSILGTMNYYARFIPEFAEKTRDLRRLTRKDIEFKWSEDLSKKLDALRLDLERATPQEIPDTYSPKVLHLLVLESTIEASCYDGKGRLINRAGRALGESELNYTPAEKALLTLILGLDKFGTYCRGPLVVQTDCKGLDLALKLKERPERINRLMLRLPPDLLFYTRLVPKREVITSALKSTRPPEEIFYTDGACARNGRKNCIASWAVLATLNPKLTESGLVDAPKPSNQVAEIFAAIRACQIALQHKLKEIILVTDSRYVEQSMNVWFDRWITNGWKDSRGRPVVNKELLATLLKLRNSLTITCLHTKGHADDDNNNKVDLMAKAILEKHLAACLVVTGPPEIDQSGDYEIQTIKERLPQDPKLGEKFLVSNDNLYFRDPSLPALCRNRLYVPRTCRTLLMKIAHDDPLFGGHLGQKKTRGKLAGYYWPAMTSEIAAYIDQCETCQRNKVDKQPKYGLLQPITTSSIFERVHVDIIGPLNVSSIGNRYIITAIDAFSRYAAAKAVPKVKTDDIIGFLVEEIIARYGPPKYLVSDNGPQFVSDKFKEFLQETGIKGSRTTDYHPSANGMDERFNGTIVKILKNYIANTHCDWDKKLPWALFIYNTTTHTSTKLTPYAVLFGYNPRVPLASPLSEEVTEQTSSLVGTQNRHDNIRQYALRNSGLSRESYKQYYDRHRQKQSFQLMDQVLVRAHRIREGQSRKLLPRWEGPYSIISFLQHNQEPQAVVILDTDRLRTRRVAFQDVKPYKPPDSSDGAAPTQDLHTDLHGPRPSPTRDIISAPRARECGSSAHSLGLDKAPQAPIAGSPTVVASRRPLTSTPTLEPSSPTARVPDAASHPSPTRDTQSRPAANVRVPLATPVPRARERGSTANRLGLDQAKQAPIAGSPTAVASRRPLTSTPTLEPSSPTACVPDAINNLRSDKDLIPSVSRESHNRDPVSSDSSHDNRPALPIFSDNPDEPSAESEDELIQVEAFNRALDASRLKLGKSVKRRRL